MRRPEFMVVKAANLAVSVFVVFAAASSSAQEKNPLTARDYYNELKAANGFARYKDTYACFRDDNVPTFYVISRASDVIYEMRKAGAAPPKDLLKAKDFLFIETYYKGVSNGVQMYDPVGKEGTDWQVEFRRPPAPIHLRIRWSINLLTGRYRMLLYALDRSDTLPTAEVAGKCEAIHARPETPGPVQ